MKRFNSIKKSRKKSKDIDEKIEYLNKECQKTGLQEVMTTTNMYTIVNTVPASPAVRGDVPDPDPANGITSNNWTQPLGNDQNGNPASAPPTSFPRIWNNAGYSDPTDGLMNKNDLNGDGTNIPIYELPSWQDPSEVPAGAVGGMQIEVGGMDPGIVGGYLDANGFTTTTGDNIRLGAPNFKTHPDLFKPVKYWTPFSIFNPFIDAYWPGGTQTPKYGGIVKETGTGQKFALFTAYLYVGGGRNQYQISPNTHEYPIVLKTDNLGDPLFLPIDISRTGLSPQGFYYLKNQAGTDVASGGVNYDLYNYLDKRYGIEASNWYENNPTLPHESNPHIPPREAPYLPLASNPNDSRYSDVVSDIDINTGLGAKPGDELAFGGFGGRKPVDPNKKQNRATTQNIINHINSGGFVPLPKGWTKEQAKQFYNNYVNGTLSESLNEGVKLGHFEPEVLTVDIEKLRKGIVPDFPKDPPPEMINGYSSKSRLAPKIIKGEPFIKITKKDLARNHTLTDKEINDFMNDINLVNNYIKENPAQLKYAMIRYPKDDPRLAQLNYKMDQMKAASDQYMDTHFPENRKLFSKLQDKIIRNMNQTDPKNFTGHKDAPKFVETDIIDEERRRKVIARHFKKKK